ncbi:hypothetical protein Tco_0994076 [Tanacetum coccineum]
MVSDGVRRGDGGDEVIEVVWLGGDDESMCYRAEVVDEARRWWQLEDGDGVGCWWQPRWQWWCSHSGGKEDESDGVMAWLG